MAKKRKLVALMYLCIGNYEYFLGDEIDEDNVDAEALVNSGAAIWVNPDVDSNTPKARLATAQVGDVGINVVGAETEVSIPGTVPKTDSRKKSSSTTRKKKKAISE